MPDTPVSTPATPATTPAVPKAPPWWVQFSINSGIVALHQVLHSPSQAEYLKVTMLELRDAINSTYPGE